MVPSFLSATKYWCSRDYHTQKFRRILSDFVETVGILKKYKETAILAANALGITDFHGFFAAGPSESNGGLVVVGAHVNLCTVGANDLSDIRAVLAVQLNIALQKKVPVEAELPGRGQHFDEFRTFGNIAVGELIEEAMDVAGKMFVCPCLAYLHGGAVDFVHQEGDEAITDFGVSGLDEQSGRFLNEILDLDGVRGGKLIQ